jgi:hypothetical protein
MRFRNSRLASGVAVIAAVLALAVALLVSRGVVDALLMIVVVAVLAGLYMLRRHARAVLLYRRPTLHRQHPRDVPVSSAPAAGRGDVTGAGGAGAVHLGDVGDPRVSGRR